MENLQKCPEYLKGNAEEGTLLKNKVVFCSASVCPYNKEIPASLEGEPITLCRSKGLLKKVEIENPDEEKKENRAYTPSSPKFDGKLPTASYFQFK